MHLFSTPWTHYIKTLSPFMKRAPLLQENIQLITQQQVRTTFILKRRTPPLLHKKGHSPRRLRTKDYIYDLVQDTDTVLQPDIQIVLTEYVDGLGNKGDKVSVRPNFGYNQLLSGLAVYATPENIEKYKKDEVPKGVQYSTPTAQRMINILSNKTLSVVMNKEMPWTLKPWHVKTSFRKCGYHVPEDTITIPSKPIQGPNMDLEGKEFFVTVVINKTEKVEVRCRIHHWSTSITDRIPYEFKFWENPTESIFPQQIKEELN